MKKTMMMLTLAISMVAVGCGSFTSGKGHDTGGPLPPTPEPVAKARAAISAIPGGHAYAKTTKTTASFNLGLVEHAYAQTTTTVSLSQSWNGVCNLSPDVTSTVSYLVQGLGQNNAPNCTSQWFNDSDGSSAAANAQTGQLVLGNGTLSNLAVWTSNGTVVTTGTSIHVWVLRNHQALDTGIGCTLTAGNDILTCSSVTQYQALDKDFVVVTVTKPSTDKIVGLNVLFTK